MKQSEPNVAIQKGKQSEVVAYRAQKHNKTTKTPKKRRKGKVENNKEKKEVEVKNTNTKIWKKNRIKHGEEKLIIRKKAGSLHR